MHVRIEVEEAAGEERDGGSGALAGRGKDVAEQIIEPWEVVFADGSEAAFHLRHVRLDYLQKGGELR